MPTDHPITIQPAGQRWRAIYAGHVIADSNDAVILSEASMAPVVYFPRKDVGMEYMSRTERSTHCPFKGDASYYSLLMDGHLAENVVWTYETPKVGMEAITDRLAFYPDKVEVYPVDDAAVNPRHHEDPVIRAPNVDAIVQHTDSGSGASQRPHWDANVEEPPLEDEAR